MTLLKKTTDGCAGVATFVCGLFLLQKYMTFKPLDDPQYLQYINDKIKYSNLVLDKEITEAPSKFIQFLDPDIAGYDYRLPLILLLTLLISVLVSIIASRLPFIGFSSSLGAATEIAYVFAEGMINVQTGLFLLGGTLLIVGNVYECIVRDRDDGRHRLWICSRIALIYPSISCLVFTKIAEKIPLENIDLQLPIIKDIAFKVIKSENMEYLTKIGWMFGIILAITTLLYNVYFIDLILTAIPLGYTIYLLYSEKLTFHPEIFTVLAVICFMTHVALVTCESNLSRKEQLRLRENQSEKQTK